MNQGAARCQREIPRGQRQWNPTFQKKKGGAPGELGRERVGSAEDEDPTSGRVKRSRMVSAVRQATSRKAREVAHPQLFQSLLKTNPSYASSLKWPTRWLVRIY